MSFIEDISFLAIKFMKQEGILASLTIAQAILESNSGKSELAVKANNLFGIKASSSWIGAIYKKMTTEFVNGKELKVLATFCKFQNIEECFEYRSKVFLKRDRYKRIWGVTDYREAARIIYECGYATDPNYPQRLIELIERNELNKYDKEEVGMVKIFIDPGHGGSDSGGNGNGLKEKDITLSISLKIRDFLQNYENVQIKLSREKDETISLAQRTNLANAWGADFLLSVHINAGGGTGYEDYIYLTANNLTQSYQNILHGEITKVLDLRDRGKKRADFHMLRESNMPAFLSENGFIDHTSDSAKLKQISYIEKIAEGHVNGIVKAFGLKKKEGGSNVEEQKLTESQEKIRQEAMRLGITDGKNPFREVNQFYTWAVTVPLAKRIEELEKKIKSLEDR